MTETTDDVQLHTKGFEVKPIPASFETVLRRSPEERLYGLLGIRYDKLSDKEKSDISEVTLAEWKGIQTKLNKATNNNIPRLIYADIRDRESYLERLEPNEPRNKHDRRLRNALIKATLEKNWLRPEDLRSLTEEGQKQEQRAIVEGALFMYTGDSEPSQDGIESSHSGKEDLGKPIYKDVIPIPDRPGSYTDEEVQKVTDLIRGEITYPGDIALLASIDDVEDRIDKFNELTGKSWMSESKMNQNRMQAAFHEILTHPTEREARALNAYAEKKSKLETTDDETNQNTDNEFYLSNKNTIDKLYEDKKEFFTDVDKNGQEYSSQVSEFYNSDDWKEKSLQEVLVVVEKIRKHRTLDKEDYEVEEWVLVALAYEDELRKQAEPVEASPAVETEPGVIITQEDIDGQPSEEPDEVLKVEVPKERKSVYEENQELIDRLFGSREIFENKLVLEDGKVALLNYNLGKGNWENESYDFVVEKMAKVYGNKRPVESTKKTVLIALALKEKNQQQESTRVQEGAPIQIDAKDLSSDEPSPGKSAVEPEAEEKPEDILAKIPKATVSPGEEVGQGEKAELDLKDVENSLSRGEETDLEVQKAVWAEALVKYPAEEAVGLDAALNTLDMLMTSSNAGNRRDVVTDITKSNIKDILGELKESNPEDYSKFSSSIMHALNSLILQGLITLNEATGVFNGLGLKE